IESESVLTSLVDYSPEAILVTDLDDKIIIFNQSAARDFGFGDNEMTGINISELIPSTELIECNIISENNIAQTRDIVCRQHDGSKFPALLVSTPLGVVNEPPIAKLYFIKNISESANYQEMIIKLDRSASRGRMARDIAHEINNYLAILQGNIELAPLFIAKNNMEKLEQKLGIMKNTVDKITNFTEGLTRFSNETPEYNKEDLNQLIENLISFIKPQNKFDNIRIETKLADDIPLVEIDNGQIQLLLVNLISNGAEAQADNDGDKWVKVETRYEALVNSVRILVSDGGPGVEEDKLNDIFVKRFSTKREGTGLGLITSKNIAENHKGTIAYQRNNEAESVFNLLIPASRPVDCDASENVKNHQTVNVK
ncbi:MAG: ATP-binding protein, partial [Candidatus Zixiibacteriota bacterium]